MDILINVADLRLRTTLNNRRLVAGTREYIRFTFCLPDDWDDFVVFAQFTQDGVSYNKYLKDDGTVTLPQEITNGAFELALQGNLGDVVAKTFPITFEVERDPITSDASSTEITLSLYDQMLELLGVNPTDSVRVATSDEVEIYLGLATGYTVTYNLNNISVDGTAPLMVKDGGTLVVVLTPTNDNNTISELVVTMNDINITEASLIDGNIVIENVSGDIVITAMAN